MINLNLNFYWRKTLEVNHVVRLMMRATLYDLLKQSESNGQLAFLSSTEKMYGFLESMYPDSDQPLTEDLRESTKKEFESISDLLEGKIEKAPETIREFKLYLKAITNLMAELREQVIEKLDALWIELAEMEEEIPIEDPPSDPAKFLRKLALEHLVKFGVSDDSTAIPELSGLKAIAPFILG